MHSFFRIQESGSSVRPNPHFLLTLCIMYLTMAVFYIYIKLASSATWSAYECCKIMRFSLTHEALQTIFSQRTPLTSIPGSACRPMRCRKCWAPSPSVASICSLRARPTGFGSGKRHKAINWQCHAQSLRNDQMSDGVGYCRRRGCFVLSAPSQLFQIATALYQTT